MSPYFSGYIFDGLLLRLIVLCWFSLHCIQLR